MNINYGDTNLQVRYLEAFLQSEYSSTLRVSGIYDTYTHTNLIEYNKLPKVESVDVFYNHLINDFYDDLKDFRVVRLSNTVTFMSKSISQLPELDVAMDNLKNNGIFEYVRKFGWTITKFITYVVSNETYLIEITQETRKNLIPADAISLINLSTTNIIIGAKLNGNLLVKDTTGTKCCMMVPCEPNTDYLIVHRFEDIDNPDNPSEPIHPTIEVACSPYEQPSLKYTSGSISNNQVFTSEKGTINTYTTVGNSNSIIVAYDYDRRTYLKSILVLKKPSNYSSDFSYINISEFLKEYWLINTKYIDYLLGSVICEYSDEEDIGYAQELLSQICVDYVPSKKGIYTSDFRDAVLRYQRKNNILFSLGYIDMETEAKMLIDVNNKVTMKIY